MEEKYKTIYISYKVYVCANVYIIYKDDGTLYASLLVLE